VLRRSPVHDLNK
jgi:hypothetical protein